MFRDTTGNKAHQTVTRKMTKREEARLNFIKVVQQSIMLLALSLFGVGVADAKDPPQPKVKGQLVTTAPDDPNLKWAPCPDIFPAGCEVTVLSGNIAKGASDVFLRTPGNYDLQQHWHHSTEHVVLVKGKFSVTFEGGKQAMTSPGAYTHIPGGMPHTARCEGSEPCVIFIGFEKPVDAFATKKK